MDITLKTTISQLDEQTYEIRSECVVGEKIIRRSEAYHAPMLMESRFLTGTLEERLETMRAAAEVVTEKEIRAVVAHMAATKATAVATTLGHSMIKESLANESVPEGLADPVVEIEPPVAPIKKTRKPRTTKKQTTQTPEENQE